MLWVGKTVTGSVLTKEFDHYFRMVLADSIEVLPRQRKEQQRYKIRKKLPTRDEYTVLRSKRFTTTVETLVEDAYQGVEELTQEMRDWYDNLPESFQNADKGERINDAADTLENIVNNKPELSDAAMKTEVVFLPHFDTNSRPKRAAEYADMMSTAAMALREREDEESEDGDTADTLENDSSELESVEFPGMYS